MEPNLSRKGTVNPLIFMLCLIAFSGKVNAAWTDVSAPFQTIGFGLDPASAATVYVTVQFGANPGVYKSVNSGDTYGAIPGDAGTNYRGIAVNPTNNQVLVAGRIGATGGPVYRSLNGGATFVAPTTGTGNHQDWKLAFSGSGTNVVYAGGRTFTTLTPTGQLLWSNDAGDNWTSVSIATDNDPPVYSVAADPTNPLVAYAGVRPQTGGFADGVYKTTNGGASWTLLAGGLPAFGLQVDSIAINPANSSIVFVTASNGQIFRSTNAGVAWSKVHDPFDGAGNVAGFTPVRGLAVNPADPRVVYAVGGTSGTPRVIYSTDCGNTWNNDGDFVNLGNQPSQVAIDISGLFVYVLDNLASFGLYKKAPVAGTVACPVGGGPVNNPPVATDDSLTTDEDTAGTTGNVLTNDSDGGDGGALSVTAFNMTSAQGGTVVDSGGNTYTYTPPANFNGSDSFNYTLSDGTDTDVGTVNITVDPIDDPPVGNADAANASLLTPTVVNVLANDNDVDGDTLSVTAVTQGSLGSTVAISGGGTTVTFTDVNNSAGTETFTYDLFDGTTTISGITVTMTVSDLSPPAASPPSEEAAAAPVTLKSTSSSGSGGSSFGLLLALAMCPLLLFRAGRGRK